MNDAHLHLLVNHLPILGAFLSLPVLALAFFKEGLGSLRAGALLLVLAALGAGASMRTGEGAEEVVENLPDVSEPMIEEHEELAEAALAVSIVGAFAGLGVALWSQRKGEVQRAALAGLLLLNVAEAGVMAAVGRSGGPIRHTEIRDGAAGTGGQAGQGGEAAEGGEHEEEEDDD